MADLAARLARLVKNGIGCAARFNVVLDTNVLLDAVAGRHTLRTGGAARIQSNALRVVNYAFEHGVVCFTESTKHELRGVFLGFVGEGRLPGVERQGEFNWIVAHARTVRPGPLIRFCKDMGDDKIIKAAVGAKAAYLVTFDRRLLDLRYVGGTQVLRPEDFIRQVMGEDVPEKNPRSAFSAAGRCGRSGVWLGGSGTRGVRMRPADFPSNPA